MHINTHNMAIFQGYILYLLVPTMTGQKYSTGQFTKNAKIVPVINLVIFINK